MSKKYGLDAELEYKKSLKYDVEAEGQAQEWLEEVTGVAFSGSDFQDSLKDGIILCKAINEIAPGSIKKINKMKAPFMQMENVSSYIDACKELGMPEHDLFVTVDLYEGKDMGQVVQNIHALGRQAQSLGYDGPTLGAKLSEKREVEFTEEQLAEARGAVPLLEANANKGASQAGMRSIGNQIVKTNDTGDGGSTLQSTSGSGNNTSSGIVFGKRRQISEQ
eukprot:TRINITY_DN4_c0_g1_i11.p2 TRINITY_DN4_c0_g1~~TRINITY_DN4_c0_g1_i11.p2  ORF type:complete len:221 (+),score=81.17 TRINITY_DN4_c0_g1_i11:1876-2538(+)